MVIADGLTKNGESIARRNLFVAGDVSAHG
jgi:hypothetical protein